MEGLSSRARRGATLVPDTLESMAIAAICNTHFIRKFTRTMHTKRRDWHSYRCQGPRLLHDWYASKRWPREKYSLNVAAERVEGYCILGQLYLCVAY